jgi:methylated-DNA-protein-cysteine methyltransferase-like protein
MAVVQISPFTKKVMQQILQIPHGKVATYKQIAELAGKPQASRGVSWILHSCSTAYKLPWHRVLNSKGGISFDRKSSNFQEQKKRLEKEGIVFSEDAKLDLKIFQWKKRLKKEKAVSGKPQMFRR